jgi:signal transduction histidine kinase
MDSFPGPLGQVITNLVLNALIHGFDKTRPGTVKVHAMPLPGDRVRIVVADDGHGIAPEHLSRIFDPFFTTRLGQGGSGLGLHIIYTIVTRVLGGQIDVNSAPGRGAVFTVEIPMVPPQHVDARTRGTHAYAQTEKH